MSGPMNRGAQRLWNSRELYPIRRRRSGSGLLSNRSHSVSLATTRPPARMTTWEGFEKYEDQVRLL